MFAEMTEDYIDNELDESLEDIEPIESGTELYEHFRVVVDKGQTASRQPPTRGLSWPTANR